MTLRLMALALLTALMIGTMRFAYADGVDDYLKAQMTTRHIPGLSVAVVQDGKVVKAQGYGLSDADAKTLATPDTVYQIGSLTKQFTATAILTLVQQGKMGVDDPISKHIDGLPAAWNVLTVRELLNQTSGLHNYREGLDVMAGGAAKDYTAAQVIKMADAKPLLFKPGTQFAYSNTNYHLLGMIVEKVSGKSYGDFMQQTFFGPLGMTHTRMTHPGLVVPNQAQGFVWDGTALRSSPIVFSPSIDFGDDGIITTVLDLVKWNAALDGDALLNAAGKHLLWTPALSSGSAPIKYASGWVVTPVRGHTILWHNGGIFAGFTGAIFRLPSDKLTLIVLTNSFDISGQDLLPPLYGLTLGLANQYLPDLPKPQLAEDASTPGTSAPDTDPQIAALVKTVSAQIASGTLDKSLFAPTLQAALTPAAINPAHDLLAPLGPLTSLTLLRRAPDGSALYRAQYGTATVNWLIAVDKDHKITLLRPRPQ